MKTEERRREMPAAIVLKTEYRDTGRENSPTAKYYLLTNALL